MKKWNVIAPPTFMNELIGLPTAVSRLVTQKVKVLERDPISAQGDAKKIGNHKPPIYRVRIGAYRLFYSFGDGWVKLIGVRKRDDRTYADALSSGVVPEGAPPPELLAVDLHEEPAIYEVDVSAPTDASLPEDDAADAALLGVETPAAPLLEPRLLPVTMSEGLLRQWRIPSPHWAALLAARTEDDLLLAGVPTELFDRICDILYPRSLAEIERQPELVLHEPEDLDRFVEGELTTFLLRLDADQQRILETSLEGPALVKGGPGTGKSVLALYRVQRLVAAGRTPILFTTYTNALVRYSEQLLERLLGGPPKERGVEVNTVDAVIFRQYVRAYGKPNFAIAGQQEALLAQVLATIELPAPNQFDRKVRQEVLARLGNDYLLDEFNSVIEARGVATRDEYLTLERRGRGLPLRANLREAIWALYVAWSTALEREGLTTWERVRRQALELALSQPTKPYQAVIIDEAQDLSPVALRFLLASVAAPQGVYLTADASQSLYQRGFSWKQIHSDLSMRGRTVLLRRNYRNTAAITAACAAILAGTEAGDAESIVQEPAAHQGIAPTLLLARDDQHEVEAIRSFFAQAARELRLPLHAGAVLCHSQALAQQIAARLSRQGVAAEFMSGKQIDLRKPVVKVLTLHSSKGLEFPMVAIMRLEAGSLPHELEHLPEEEQAVILDQQRRLFYVGCSRAMRALLVCAVATAPSPFVAGLNEPLWQRC
ncbi:3'-5' exonuclease [Candidatus Chloroploca sp. Khr17]|uniref:3'-5' exonuclease n=1 Tax=Candidatus Chloroploca sp. Khr17 TaxID=2496869 RepID=UPI00101DAEED|nr:3'-5' exonuclease [Candidatus Chloroploca sp. Khr17]